MEEKLFELYLELKEDIEKKIDVFKSIWNNGDEREIFAEIAFCILTPQSKAKNAWKVIEKLKENNLLYVGTSLELVDYLNIVRFKNKKSEYLILLREFMTKNNKLCPKEILSKINSDFEKRDFLVKNVKGMSYKEASHCLRNLGFIDNLSILDRHILRQLLEFKVIDEIPNNLNSKKYLEIENKMKEFSEKVKIPLGHLDFVFWYKVNNELFK